MDDEITNLDDPTVEQPEDGSISPVSQFINIFEERACQIKPDSNIDRRASLKSPLRKDSDNSFDGTNRQNVTLSTVNTRHSFDSDRSNQIFHKSLHYLNCSTNLGTVQSTKMNDLSIGRIDDLDISQIPGYIIIPDNLPDWKKHHLEKKNKEVVNAYLAERDKEEKEKNKYGDIPQWKKDLLIKKEKELSEKMSLENQQNIDKYDGIPQWKKDILMKKEQQK